MGFLMRWKLPILMMLFKVEPIYFFTMIVLGASVLAFLYVIYVDAYNAAAKKWNRPTI
jgi:hypothetical protein